MARFFFHVLDDMDVPDEEGTELRDIADARALATRSARVLMCETLKDKGRIHLRHRIDVEDERGAVVASVRFRDAVTIEG